MPEISVRGIKCIYCGSVLRHNPEYRAMIQGRSDLAQAFLGLMDALGALSNRSDLDGHGLNAEDLQLIDRSVLYAESVLRGDV